jgi:arginine/lysine/ornithine decarboxylase
MTGVAVERVLRERFGLAAEMGDHVDVVCLVTIGDTPESVDRLVDAFVTLSSERPTGVQRRDRTGCRSSGNILAAERQMLTPREAFFASARSVPLNEAIGEVAAELVVPFPPGIPVLIPGEVISHEKAEYLREGLANGAYVGGAADPTLTTVRVVASL